ncbi:MAG: OmpH family outer membrane protein [Planctomycetota bacterium]|jgi:Skp family chaperone for outer membrane proteins
MARRERMIVHALLGVSLLLHLITLAGGSPAAVMAGVRAFVQDLGPAERLTLVEAGTEADPLVLRARSGRLAWSDQPTHQTWAMAVVDDREVISRLMTKDVYNDRRQALREELQPQSAEFERRMQAIIAESQAIDPDDEAAMQDAFQRYQQVQQEFQQWQQSARNRGDLLEGEILKEAYAELVAAVEVVADRRNVDLVLRAVRTDADFAEPDSRSVSLSMRMRTALLRPEGMDMTEDVLEELGL